MTRTIAQYKADAWQAYRDLFLIPEREGDWSSLYENLYIQFFGKQPDRAKMRANKKKFEEARRFCSSNGLSFSLWLHAQIYWTRMLYKSTGREADPLFLIRPTSRAKKAFNQTVRRHRRLYKEVASYKDFMLTPLGDLYRTLHASENERTRFAISWARMGSVDVTSMAELREEVRERTYETWDELADPAWKGMWREQRRIDSPALHSYQDACIRFTEPIVSLVFHCARAESWFYNLRAVDRELPYRCVVDTSTIEVEDLAAWVRLSYGAKRTVQNEIDETPEIKKARHRIGE